MTVFTKRAVEVFPSVGQPAIGDARTWGTEIERALSSSDLWVSATEYGVTLDGTTDDTDAVQAALDGAAEDGLELVFPAGTILVSDTLRVPSNSRIRGAGIDITIIKMDESVGRGTTVMQTGDVDDQRTNIRISDLTIDCNEDRWDVTGGDYGVGLAIVYSEYVWVERVKVKDAFHNCLDVASPFPFVDTPLTYDPQPSRYVWVTDCEASGSGDDCFVTHHSSHVWFTRCYAHDSGGRADQHNSNAFECDDGSRNVHYTDCVAKLCHSGIQIKSHDDGPAPYNVICSGFRIINCINGVSIRHSGVGDGSVSMDLDHTGGDDYYSPTAYGIQFVNTQIIAPKVPQPWIDEGADALLTEWTAINLQNYSDVSFVNTRISDGTEDLSNKEYQAAMTGLTAVIRLAVSARRILFRDTFISGFPDETLGIVANSTTGDTDDRCAIFFDGLVMRNAPLTPIQFNSDRYDMYIDKYYIAGDHLTDGTIGINFGGSAVATAANQLYVGIGQIRGYDTLIKWNSVDYTTPMMGFPVPLHLIAQSGGLSVGIEGNVPATAARMKTATSASLVARAVRSNSTSLRYIDVFEDSSGVIAAKTSIINGRFQTHPTSDDDIHHSGGSGSPEGVISAKVGSTYVRTNGGGQTTLYVKESGSGNTGWVPVRTGLKLNLGAGNLTIASGVIAPVLTNNYIDTEAAAATDDLTNATGGIDGDVLEIHTTSSSRDVVVKHLAGGAGEFFTKSGADVTLGNTSAVIIFTYNALLSRWIEK